MLQIPSIFPAFLGEYCRKTTIKRKEVCEGRKEAGERKGREKVDLETNVISHLLPLWTLCVKQVFYETKFQNIELKIRTLLITDSLFW